MRFRQVILGVAAMACLIAPAPALAGSLAQEVASCFPPAPAGYTADEVDFGMPLGDSLARHLAQGHEVGRSYEGEQTISISLMGKKLDSFKFAAQGKTPGCEPTEVAGRKAAVMYETMLVLMVGDKAAVLFEFEEPWAESKQLVKALAAEFNYAKLESLLK